MDFLQVLFPMVAAGFAPIHQQEKLPLCCQKELTSLTFSDPKHYLGQEVAFMRLVETKFTSGSTRGCSIFASKKSFTLQENEAIENLGHSNKG